MHIATSRIKGPNGVYYRADCLDLPGSPLVGQGTTQVEAVAHLAYLLLFGKTGGEYSRPWREFVKEDGQIMINGKPWSLPVAGPSR